MAGWMAYTAGLRTSRQWGGTQAAQRQFLRAPTFTLCATAVHKTCPAHAGGGQRPLGSGREAGGRQFFRRPTGLVLHIATGQAGSVSANCHGRQFRARIGTATCGVHRSVCCFPAPSLEHAFAGAIRLACRRAPPATVYKFSRRRGVGAHSGSGPTFGLATGVPRSRPAGCSGLCQDCDIWWPG